MKFVGQHSLEIIRNPFKTCSCGRTYSAAEWSRLDLRGWMADAGVHALELRNCTACSSTMSVARHLRELELVVDRLGAKVSYQGLTCGGWKAVVTGIELPPHFGRADTAAGALAEVLTFALRIGALRHA